MTEVVTAQTIALRTVTDINIKMAHYICAATYINTKAGEGHAAPM